MISVRRLCEHVFVPRYTETQAREAVTASQSYAEALRRLGLGSTGANWRTLLIWIERWNISTAHFDPRALQRREVSQRPLPLEEILVEGSGYSRGHLKKRLYREGLKERRCEVCGQGETWRGRQMGLILDHINGVRDDHRIDNLRILCPNCAATLDTHCGRKNRIVWAERECLHCGDAFGPRYERQRYCSRTCGTRSPKPTRGVPAPERRRVQRPPFDQLLREIETSGYRAVGRRYGVSDNTVRKWVRQYEREQAARAP
jgi:hypothetical protein